MGFRGKMRQTWEWADSVLSVPYECHKYGGEYRNKKIAKKETKKKTPRLARETDLLQLLPPTGQLKAHCATGEKKTAWK